MSMKKVLGLAVLIAAFVVVGASRANAATAQELQDQINALLAQIGSLQGGSSTSCYSFTRDLTVGSQGADVTALQNYLAAKGYFNVAATGYFGSITAQAAAAWQSANGVMPAAGYFGAISRAKYNSMCSSTTPTTGDDDDDDDDDDDFNAGNGAEASLEDFDVKDGDDTSIEEGDEDAEVMEIEFDVEDADVEVQRIEVVASSSAGNGEEDPWDVFESATLWMDGDDVATVDNLDDEDNWDEQSNDGQYSFRFNGVDSVVNEGDTAKFVVSFTFQDNLDDLDESWELWVDDEGVRALDEAGIDQYTGDDTDTVSIDIEAAGGDDELSLSESSDNPDSATLEVEEDEKSEWLSLAVMDLEADTDTEVKDFKVNVVINSGADSEDFDDVISDLVLIIDGEEYDDWSVADGSLGTGTVTFDLDGDDIIVGEGEEVSVEVQAEFLATTTGAYNEGTTVTVEVPSATFDTIDAEGVDSGEDLDATKLTGSFSGNVMTLRSEGISIEPVSKSAQRTFVADDTGESDQGTFEIVFEVTAFGEDIYIDNSTPAEDNDGSEVTTSASYSVSNPGNNTSVGTLSATGGDYDDKTNSWKVAEGDTAEFTLEVIVTATSSSNAYVTLEALGYAFSDANGTHVFTVPAESGFKTSAINLLDL